MWILWALAGCFLMGAAGWYIGARSDRYWGRRGGRR